MYRNETEPTSPVRDATLTIATFARSRDEERVAGRERSYNRACEEGTIENDGEKNGRRRNLGGYDGEGMRGIHGRGRGDGEAEGDGGVDGWWRRMLRAIPT